eukprot:scaffold49492_cov72-Phaeocystis_antarctica.AAC.3
MGCWLTEASSFLPRGVRLHFVRRSRRRWATLAASAGFCCAASAAAPTRNTPMRMTRSGEKPCSDGGGGGVGGMGSGSGSGGGDGGVGP